jgi:hypothetical protein
MPVPDSASEAVEVLPVKVKFAEADPVAFGLKIAVNDTLLPAPIVSGNERPVKENSVLFTLAADTTTLAPEAVKVPVRFVLDPTVTLPKLRAPGVTFRDPVAAVVPEIGIVKLGTLDATEMLPLALALPVGV